MAYENPHKGYPGGSLGPKSNTTGIGGTHNVSVKVDPDSARRGMHKPLPGDVPHNDGGAPYCPEN